MVSPAAHRTRFHSPGLPTAVAFVAAVSGGLIAQGCRGSTRTADPSARDGVPPPTAPSGGATGAPHGASSATETRPSPSSSPGPPTGAATAPAPDHHSEGRADGGRSCGTIRKKLFERSSAEAERHRRCAVDADCVLSTGGAMCASSCPISIAASGREAMETLTRQLDESLCREYDRNGCDPMRRFCAPMVAVCRSGRCESELTE